MAEKLVIRQPDDLHVHLRRGELLRKVADATVRQFGRALVMPNTDPAILSADDVTVYRVEILRAARECGVSTFIPLMTIKLVPETAPEMIVAARAAGAIAGKLYPDGVTTNSAGGVRNFRALYPVYEAMQACGMVLCLHGEMPGVFCLDRELAFLSVLGDIHRDFPSLRIVLEHISTQAAAEYVLSLGGNVAATITVHHLLLTLDDVVGGTLSPHLFCKPIAKGPGDRAALIELATSGHPRVFLGTDSAPHLRDSKECDGGAAGVFTAPLALPFLAEIFEQRGRLDNLERFTSVNGAQFYDLPLNKGTVTLVRERYEGPLDYGDVVAFGSDMNRRPNWRVVGYPERS